MTYVTAKGPDGKVDFVRHKGRKVTQGQAGACILKLQQRIDELSKPQSRKAAPEPGPGCEFVTVELDSSLVDRVRMVLAERGTDLGTYMRLQLRAFRSTTALLTLRDKMPFGKYQGELVEDVCRADPGYIEYIVGTSATGKFDVDVLRLLAEMAAVVKSSRKGAEA